MGFGVWRGERTGISGLAVVLLTCDCCGHFGNDVDDQSKRFFFSCYKETKYILLVFSVWAFISFLPGRGRGLVEETVEVGCSEF